MAVALTIRECVFPVCGPTCRRDCPLPQTPENSAPSPVVATRDDLIRLVVGMQWREAIALMAYDAVADGVGAWLHRDAMVYDLRPAVDIVDEWLGVR